MLNPTVKLSPRECTSVSALTITHSLKQRVCRLCISFAMSRVLGGVLRSPRLSFAACTIPIVCLSILSRTALDEQPEDSQADAAAKVKAAFAKQEEVLKAAKEFTTFADNGPSGMA